MGAGLALLLYLLAVVLQPVITFYDNDDLNIAWALAGYRSGTPSFAHPFVNPITAALVSGLYTVLPSVPWWYTVQTVCMIIGCTVMSACMCKVCSKNGLPLVVPIIAIGILFGGACYYAISQVMFTLTSTLLGMAATAMVLAADGEDRQGLGRFYWLGSVLLIATSLLIRQSSGLCGACFYFGALLIRLAETLGQPRRGASIPATATSKEMGERGSGRLQKWPPMVKSLLVTGVGGALVIMGFVSLNAWGRANQHSQAFVEFEDARAAFMDYPHDPYYENPGLYEALGWDATLYDLTNAWFYMDPRINGETLEAATSLAQVNNVSTLERARRSVETFAEFLGKYPIAVYLCVMVGCTALAFGLVAWLRRARTVTILGGVCMLLGAGALMGYLLFQGRMNLRTFMTLAFPTIITLMLLTASAYGGKAQQARAAIGQGPLDETTVSAAAKGNGWRGKSSLFILTACMVVLLVPMVFCGYKIFRTVVSYDSVEALEDAHAVVDYAMAHPDNLYIRDVYAGNNYDALTVYVDKRPTNLMDWGGCDMYTRARLAQWRFNGYEESPYADVFLQDNVYYVCQLEGAYLPMLADYMESVWGTIGYEVADTLQNGLAVVRFLSP